MGSVASLRYGKQLKAKKISGNPILVSLCIGFLFTLAACFLHGACIEINICSNSGDGNMGYWFHSFFATPLFLVIIIAASN